MYERRNYSYICYRERIVIFLQFVVNIIEYYNRIGDIMVGQGGLVLPFCCSLGINNNGVVKYMVHKEMDHGI